MFGILCIIGGACITLWGFGMAAYIPFERPGHPLDDYDTADIARYFLLGLFGLALAVGSLLVF